MTTDENEKVAEKQGWSNTAKAGAAVGSAALLAALLFAGREYKKRNEKKPPLKILPEGMETD